MIKCLGITLRDGNPQQPIARASKIQKSETIDGEVLH